MQTIKPLQNLEIQIRTSTGPYKNQKHFSGNFDVNSIKQLSQKAFEEVNQDNFEQDILFFITVIVWLPDNYSPDYLTYFVTNLNKSEIKSTLDDVQHLLELTIKGNNFDLNKYQKFINKVEKNEFNKKIPIEKF